MAYSPALLPPAPPPAPAIKPNAAYLGGRYAASVRALIYLTPGTSIDCVVRQRIYWFLLASVRATACCIHQHTYCFLHFLGTRDLGGACESFDKDPRLPRAEAELVGIGPAHQPHKKRMTALGKVRRDVRHKVSVGRLDRAAAILEFWSGP